MKNLDKIINEAVAKVLKEEIGGDYNTLAQKFVVLNRISRHIDDARNLINKYRLNEYNFAKELGNAAYDISDAYIEIKESLIDMGISKEEYQKLTEMY